MVDFIPDEIQAITGGRGGWTYTGSAMSGVTQISALGYHPDANKVVAADQTVDKLWDVAAGTSLGAAFGGNAVPFFHRGLLIFPVPFAGAHTPGYYDGTTVGTFTAPTGTRCGTTYKDHSVLAGSASLSYGGGASNPGRIWFSKAGDPTSWDTTYGWWDTSNAIIALGAVSNAILVFHQNSTERLRGNTPPPGSDMVLEPFLPNVGCIDQFSVAYWQGNVVFASPQGVYLTNGISSVDLTDAADLKTYWQSLISGYASTWRIAGGVYRDHYIVSINNGSTLVDCLCFSLTNRTAWRFTNLHGGSFVNVQVGQQEKLYMGQWNAGRVVELSSLWSPSATVKQDGDGTNPTPIIETGMFRGYDRLHRRWIESFGKQKWRFAYVDHDLRDAASDNPTAALSYCTDPAGSYTQAGLTIPATTKPTRVRRSLSPTQGGATRSQMMGLKLAVTGPYASAKLYALEAAFEPIEIGSL